MTKRENHTTFVLPGLSLETEISEDDADALRDYFEMIKYAPTPPAPEVEPVCMILHCPDCGEQHTDEGEWATKPHRSHECQNCGHVWRPADVATVGVAAIQTRGKSDSAPAPEGLKVEFTKEWCMKMAQLEGDSAIGAGVPEVEHVAVVINNNQPGWENIIETKPYVTLDVGTKLYTHPANDGLRIAVEEALRVYVDKQKDYSAFQRAMENLRAELNKK